VCTDDGFPLEFPGPPSPPGSAKRRGRIPIEIDPSGH
jgi:hypothetical protein